MVNRTYGCCAPLVSLLVLVWLSAAVYGHDTGFAHSRRTLFVTASANEILLEYRVTANADEALIEMTLMDEDGNGQIAKEERDRYFTQLAKRIGDRLSCEAAGKGLPLELVDYQLDHSLSQSFRYRIASNADELRLVDQNFAHKPGQVRIISGIGVKVELLEAVNLSHTERVPLKITRTLP